jgi:hypothetical protein
VLVDAEESLAGDEMLRSYTEAMGGSELFTLAIDAARMAPEVASAELQALTDSCGLGDRQDVDLVAVVGERHVAERHRMLSGARARYRREDDTEGALPAFTPASLRACASSHRPHRYPGRHDCGRLPSRCLAIALGNAAQAC